MNVLRLKKCAHRLRHLRKVTQNVLNISEKSTFCAIFCKYSFSIRKKCKKQILRCNFITEIFTNHLGFPPTKIVH